MSRHPVFAGDGEPAELALAAEEQELSALE